MKSVSPDGLASTVARICWPAVAVNGMRATGAADVISPSELKIGAPIVALGAVPMAFVPYRIADDLRW